MIYVSTGGNYKQTAAEVALDYFNNGIEGVELSGGKYSDTCQTDLIGLSSKVKFQVHNYFPPPSSPFVFNLASNNAEILALSIGHARSSINLAIALGRPVYSFHAGFRISPGVDELGQRLVSRPLVPREDALDIFGESISSIAEYARQEGATLLIENNVISKKNLMTFSEDPLLLTAPDEILTFMNGVPSNVGLLLDVAHLKVSSTAIGFDLVGAHQKLLPLIYGYHLSDNDGLSDSNEPISDDSWFWGDLVHGLDYYSLEIYNKSVQDLVLQEKLVKAKIAANIKKQKDS